MSNVPALLEWVPGTAAGLVALGYLIKKLRQAARALDAIEVLVSRELTHNHGTSIKDDVHGIAISLGDIQRRVVGLERWAASDPVRPLPRQEAS